MTWWSRLLVALGWRRAPLPMLDDDQDGGMLDGLDDWSEDTDEITYPGITLTTLTEPEETDAMGRADILDLQTALSRLGYSPGHLDGDWGPTTVGALDTWRSRVGRPISDEATARDVRTLTRQMRARQRAYRPISLETVQALTPLFPPEWLDALNDSMRAGLIDTHRRQIAYLSQLAHEGAWGYRPTLEEFATGEAYEGRADLGNTEPGDGRRYKGRGPIQLTGRANYRAANAILRREKVIKKDLEAHPEQVSSNPQLAFMVAELYWRDQNLNALADDADVRGITRAINGGLNGWSDRLALYNRADQLWQGGTT